MQREIAIHCGREADMQAGRYAADGHARTDGHTDWHAGRQACSETSLYRATERRIDRGLQLWFVSYDMHPYSEFIK